MAEAPRFNQRPPLSPREASPSQRAKRLLGRDWGIAYLFMAPTIAVMGGLIAYPFLRALYISFTRTTSRKIGPFVGLTNYANIWSDKFFRQSVLVTVQLTIFAVALTFLVAVLAAILLHRLGPRASVLAGLVLLPWIMPDIVRAITWKGLLDPLYGGVNRLLLDLGFIDRPLPFLGGIKTALPAVILIKVWQSTPFFAINLLAELGAVDAELYEASAIDGASAWRRFLHITLPGLRHIITIVTLLSTIWIFGDFQLIFLLTGGGPMNATKVYSVLAYQYAIAGRRYGPGIAVAMSVAPVFVVAILVLAHHLSAGHRARQAAAPPARGAFAMALRAITPPIQMFVRLLTALFWLANDAAERGIEGIRAFISRSFPSSNAHSPAEHTQRCSRRVRVPLATGALLLLLTFELAPFYMLVVTAFKTELQITRFENVLWPKPWSLDQFHMLLGTLRNFWVWLGNTALVSCATPLLSTLVASLSAYALTRLRWRGANAFASGVLVAYLMPSVMMVIPIFQLFTRFGLTNSLLSLVISYPTFILPFAIWLMMGYYSSIPAELEEEAMIDGCNRCRTFFQVVLPLTKPALITVALFGVTQAWGEFLFAATFITSESTMTLPLGLAQMIFGDVLPWGELSAAALIMAVPVLLLYSLGRRAMAQGFAARALTR